MTEEGPPRKRQDTLRIGSGEHRAVKRHDETIPRFVIEPPQTGVTAKPVEKLFPTKQFAAGEILVQENAPLPCYIVVRGTVGVINVDLEERTSSAGMLFMDSLIGEESLERKFEVSSPFRYVAVDEVTVYVVELNSLLHLSAEQHDFLHRCCGQSAYIAHQTIKVGVEEKAEIKRLNERLATDKAAVEVENADLLEKAFLLDIENADLKRRLADLESVTENLVSRVAATEERQKAVEAENARLKAKQAEMDQLLKNLGELLIGGDTLAEAMVNLGGVKGAMGLRAQNLLHTLRARAGAVRTIPIEDLTNGVDQLSD